MITQEKYQAIVEKAVRILEESGLKITPAERERFEVADFGLGELEKTGDTCTASAPTPISACQTSTSPRLTARAPFTWAALW